MHNYSNMNEEEKKPKIIPFQTNFGSHVLPGKSYVRIGLPLKTPHTVTEKFYKKDLYNFDPKKIEQISENLKVLHPKDKYEKSMTENQRYGWYHDVKLTNLDKNDPRLYFGRKMDHFIKLYLLTMEKKK